jgi:hypothetical protein
MTNASKRRQPSRAPAPGDAPRRARWSSPRALELSSAAAVAAAVVVAVLVNLLAARHYRRWDWTESGLYTLSPVTEQTLRSLSEPVQVYVLLSGADPLVPTLRHLLATYGGHSQQLTVHFVDPDQRPAEFLAVQRRYGIVVGKTEAGRIVTDAALVVATTSRHHFITQGELVQVDDAADMRARPQLEQALTGALREVTAGPAARICFVAGHGEDGITQTGPEGLASLADRLQKSNYEVIELAAPSAGGKEPIDRCRLAVVAGPKRRLVPGDAAWLRRFVEGGGNALLALSPVPDAVAERTIDLGLAPVVDLAGLALRNDFVFELDPMVRSSQGFGEAFAATAKQHPITAGLLAADEHGFSVTVEVVQSLGTRRDHEVAPTPLLETSEEAFGMVDFFAWARDPGPPEAGDGDHPGPLTVAYAAELPRRRGASPHGPRLVVVGSSSVLHSANWQLEQLRGTALFVESAVSWLAARPIVLDIPAKPSRVVGLRMTEASLTSVMRYTILYIPFGVALLGVAVALRRRAAERRRRPR